jgi:hypothetical protein
LDPEAIRLLTTGPVGAIFANDLIGLGYIVLIWARRGWLRKNAVPAPGHL